MLDEDDRQRALVAPAKEHGRQRLDDHRRQPLRCGVNVCQGCTCLVNNKAVQTCVIPVSSVAGKRVTTMEGLADGDTLHPVQHAWLDLDVPQCGFCQPGRIMNAVALRKSKRNPSDADIDAIENICRCGTYGRIRQAIKKASAAMP